MPIPKDQREAFFVSKAKKVVFDYAIRRGFYVERIHSQRIGHLMSEIMGSMYGHKVVIDSYICFRDWAWDNNLECRIVLEKELKNGKAIRCPYSHTHCRIFEALSFDKYISLLKEITFPLRTPLTRRTPVRRFR